MKLEEKEQLKVPIDILKNGIKTLERTVDTLAQEQQNSDHKIMSSVALKRMIGLALFGIAALFFVLLNYFSNIELQKFLFCCFAGVLGLSSKALLFHGILKKDQDKELDKGKIIDCRLAYYVYYPSGLMAIIGIIFVTSYKNIESMDYGFFTTVSFFLFLYLGFFVMEALDKFLGSSK